MRYLLDLSRADSRAALHALLAGALPLPAWYGCNLDALHDCLTELSEPTELVLRGGEALDASLGSYASAFRRVLRDSAAENPDLTVIWEDELLHRHRWSAPPEDTEGSGAPITPPHHPPPQ